MELEWEGDAVATGLTPGRRFGREGQVRVWDHRSVHVSRDEERPGTTGTLKESSSSRETRLRDY